MAIKVRKRNESGDDSPDEEEETPESQEVAPTEGDPFLRGSAETISWLSENQNLVYGAVAAAIVIAIGGYVGVTYMRSQAVAASNPVSNALAAYETPVEGSPVYEAMTSRDGVAKPTKTFGTTDKRWKAVYKKAGRTLEKHAGSAAVQPARLTRAAAAAQLGKAGEAIELYNAYLDSEHAKENLPIVYYGLSVAQAQKGAYQKAVSSLDKMVAEDDSYEAFALYHKGLFMAEAGKKKKAKDFFNKVLETDPKSPYKTDIERRLALM